MKDFFDEQTDLNWIKYNPQNKGEFTHYNTQLNIWSTLSPAISKYINNNLGAGELFTIMVQTGKPNEFSLHYALDKDGLAGAILSSAPCEYRDYTMIEYIVVDPYKVGSGIGTRMIKSFTHNADKLLSFSSNSFMATIDKTNIPSQRAFLKSHFVVSKPSHIDCIRAKYHRFFLNKRKDICNNPPCSNSLIDNKNFLLWKNYRDILDKETHTTISTINKWSDNENVKKFLSSTTPIGSSMTQRLGNNSNLYLCYDFNQNLIGALHLNSQNQIVTIEDMIVSPELQNLGIGTRMITSLKDNAEFFQTEHKKISSIVNNDNIASMRVIEKTGFTKSKTDPLSPIGFTKIWLDTDEPSQ